MVTMINARTVSFCLQGGKEILCNEATTLPSSMRITVSPFALLPPPLPPGDPLGYSVHFLEQYPVLHRIGILCPEEEQNVGIKI